MTLWQVGHIDCDVIQEEVAICITGHICHADAEVGVREIAHSPGASPCICRPAQNVSGLACAEVGRILDGRPGCAAVP